MTIRRTEGRAVDLALDAPPEQYAAGEGRPVHVFLRITATARPAAAGGPPPGGAPGGSHEYCEVIVIDCSGSMALPTYRKIGAARRAAAEAVGMLPDGVRFALVEGTGSARLAYPWIDRGAPPDTAEATPESREEGRRTALALHAHGGTRISAWLDLARALFAARPGAAYRHALLLTDGRDEHGSADELERVLAACAGEFTCDALGIGEDWDADQLLRVAGTLRGRVVAVDTEPPDQGGESADEALRERLTALFRELVGASTGAVLPELTVRVRPAPSAEVVLFRRLTPTVLDLTAGGTRDTGGHGFPTGPWGEETRWYELRLRADPAAPGRRPGSTERIATVWLDAEDGVALPAELPVTVRWTAEAGPRTDLGGAARHFALYDELNEATRLGSAALGGGDLATAAHELGRAVRLAHLLGDEERLRRLRRLVDVEDAATGRVRPRSAPRPGDVQSAIVAGSYTLPPAGGGDGGPPPGGSAPSGGRPVVCGACGERVRPGLYCENCAHPLPGEA